MRRHLAIAVGFVLSVTASQTAAQAEPGFINITSANDWLRTTHIVAEASDGALWYFREPDLNGKWIAESLGGNVRGKALLVLRKEGPQILAPARDGALLSNHQLNGRWTGWQALGASNVEDVSAALEPIGGLVVVVRRNDGSLSVGVQRDPQARVSDWQDIAQRTTSPPVVALMQDGRITVLTSSADHTLIQVMQERAGGAFGAARSVAGPPIAGPISALSLSDGLLVVASTQGGWFFARRWSGRTWSEPQPVGDMRQGFSKPQLVPVDSNSALVIAEGPGKTAWATSAGNPNAPTHWFDSGLPWESFGVPMRLANRKLSLVTSTLLDSVRKFIFDFHPFTLTIDQLEPIGQLFEDDNLVVKFTLTNRSGDPGTGNVTAFLDAEKLKETGTPFVAPAAGKSVSGTFGLDQFSRLIGGKHNIHVRYSAGGSSRTWQIPLCGPGCGPQIEIQVDPPTQFAEDLQTIQVSKFADFFPLTDDAAVQPGSISCSNQEADFNADIRAYNFQTLCRKVTQITTPFNIKLLQDDVLAAASSGLRVRVVGNRHSSNPQICTDGQVIATNKLKGAAPLKDSTQAEVCSKFDCEADLSGLTPQIETFEGRSTVRVGPGATTGELNKWLDEHDLSLGFAVPGFRDPTIAGAIATGTHGSSTFHPVVVSSRVRWLLLVQPDGTLKEFSEQLTDAITWKALRANLGFFGAVAQIRLEVEPAFGINAKVSWLSASDLVAPQGPHALVTGCDYGQLVWFPRGGAADAPVMAICGKKVAGQVSSDVENRLLNPSDSIDIGGLSNKVFDSLQSNACSGSDSSGWETFRADMLKYVVPPFTSARCLQGITKILTDVPKDVGAAVTSALLEVPEIGSFLLPTLPLIGLVEVFSGTCSANDITGKSYLMMSSKRDAAQPPERDWEIFIPGSRARDALAAAQAHFKLNNIYLPLIGVFLRFAPAEDTTLIAHTVAAGDFKLMEPGMFFEMPVFLPKTMKCSDQARYEKVYSDLAEILVRDYGGRGHWGKNRRSLFQFQRRLEAYGENMRAFREVLKRFDKRGIFANQYGVDMGLRWPDSPPVPADTETKGCIAD